MLMPDDLPVAGAEATTAVLSDALALLGGADAQRQQAASEYGMNLGTAFQLIDDLLDFTATEESLGKSAGVDLLEGKLTLPLILLLQRDPAMRRHVQAVIRDGNYLGVSREYLLDAVERSGSLDTARERAAEFADVLAWLATLANAVHVDLESAASEKYGAGCPGCHRIPCICDQAEKP